MVVDDDTWLCFALRLVLERLLDYEVTMAGDGEEAVCLLAQPGNVFDVVLTDVVMPGMGGEALIELMAKRWPAIPVIVMSGNSVLPTFDLPTAAGVAGGGAPSRPPRLAKPFSYSQLAQVVDQVLGLGKGFN